MYQAAGRKCVFVSKLIAMMSNVRTEKLGVAAETVRHGEVHSH